jgi:transposase
VLSENEFSSQLTELKCNAQTYLQFLKSLLRKYGKIVLIVDGVGYHFEKEHVQKFYVENKEKLKIIQLPPYSPELNPIEQTWKKIKKWLSGRIWSNKEELQQQLAIALNNPDFMIKFYDYLVR